MRTRLLIALAALVAAAIVVLAFAAGDDSGSGDKAGPPTGGATGEASSGDEPQPGPELSIMDDQLLLGASEADVERSMESFRFHGFERVRVSAFWRDHAPAPLSERRPETIRYDWTTLDRVVRAAARHRLTVMITITTPAPLWATEEPGERNPVLRPRAGEFARFAAAVAERYADQADQYGLLNEPNQGGWLQPQSVDGDPVSPHLYRELVRAAYSAVRRADPTSAVLVGELAPSGRDDRGVRRPIRPLEFLRELACVDGSGRSRDGGPCAGFEPVPLDALGHHPYNPVAAPGSESEDPDDAALGDTPRLLEALDGLVAAGRLRPGRSGPLPVHYTEYGYQTDPPDPLAGVSLERQDRWLQEAAYIAWGHRERVRSFNQFRLTDGELTDDPGNDRYREFQSGLYFADFRPKPAARSFPHPLVLRRRAGGATLFGQARPAAEREVALERAEAAGGPWERVRDVPTDARGYFELELERQEAGLYRYSYERENADEPASSPPVRVRSR